MKFLAKYDTIKTKRGTAGNSPPKKQARTVAL